MNRGKMERFALLRRQGKKQAITVGKARHSPVVVLDRYLLQGKGAVLLLQRLPGRKPNAEKLAWLVAAAGSRQAKPLPHPAHGGWGCSPRPTANGTGSLAQPPARSSAQSTGPEAFSSATPSSSSPPNSAARTTTLPASSSRKSFTLLPASSPTRSGRSPTALNRSSKTTAAADRSSTTPSLSSARCARLMIRSAAWSLGSAREPRHVRAWRVDRLPDRLRVRQESAPDQDRFPLLSSLPSAQPRPNRLRPSAVIIDRCESEVFA